MTPEETYITEIGKYYQDPNSSEMSYRTPFQNYLESIFPKVEKYVVQHDQRAQSGNKPDFIVLKNNVPVLYIEVKSIGVNLDRVEKSDQATRYFGYTNLIISDYCEFRFFRNGERYGDSISLAETNQALKSITSTGQSDYLKKTITQFTESQKEPIKSGAHLARIMGGKASRIRENVLALVASTTADKEGLEKMMLFIKESLISSLTPDDFADMYAQTLVYGLFAARYNDTTLESFSRSEARDLVPKTNPFLHEFFDHISGAHFPRRLDFIVTELCEVFSHADVKQLMEEYYKGSNLFGEEYQSPDPVIHFYEDFLREYDARKKVEMGVFYTPLPIVKFIVRGISSLLQDEFGIVDGLADNSRAERVVDVVDEKGKRKKVRDTDSHRVQILDVAVGTGTFLNEVITHIHEHFKGNEGRWSAYVESDLLPRLFGFELMMASYTIAHLKLAMTLSRTGVEKFDRRLGVYLTNTLDAPHHLTTHASLFGVLDAIAEENRLASNVKQGKPIMVVLGNPPYSGISQNKHYTGNNVYKVEPGGRQKLQEKKHWLDDDYVKFIRYAESMVEKNGEGVIAMITAHGYMDNPTFRGMRWHLRSTFDDIYVIDLHGNSNKKETAPDGSKDENVFDIKTGVAIIFAIKKRKEGSNKKKLARVRQADLFGARKAKFAALHSSTLADIVWNQIPEGQDVWRVEGAGKADYEKGFSVAELFPKNTTGIVTGIDRLSIFERKEDLVSTTNAILNSTDPYTEFGIKDGRRTKKEDRVKELREASENAPTPISYRPFDTRWMYYTTGSEVWINSPRPDVMQNFVGRDNLGLLVTKAVRDPQYNHVFCTKNISEVIFLSGTTATNTINIPLYLYSEDTNIFKAGETGNVETPRIPNINLTLARRIAEAVGGVYYPVAEYETREGDIRLTPEEIFDYVYACLHSPSYRQKYSEFLKQDFPRVPYPESKDEFARLAVLGARLRTLHLLTSEEIVLRKANFPVTGSNTVEKIEWKDSKVYINTTQYWTGVSKDVFDFYIGGYQPAQKYLKDRKGKVLINAELENYEKMIGALTATIEIMQEIG